MVDLKIGVITHSPETEEKYTRFCKDASCELIFRVGVLQYAVKTAIHMQDEMEVKAIIASSATAEVISPFVSVPVIPLHIRNEDLLLAMLQARKISRRIGFADINKNVRYNLELLGKVLHSKTKRYPFTDLEGTEQVVRMAIKDDCGVLMTPATCMAKKAQEFGLPSVLVSISELDLQEAVENAKKLITIRKQQYENLKWMGVVVNNSTRAIMTVDSNNIITLANPLAAHMAGIAESEICGKTVEQVSRTSELMRRVLGDDEDFMVIKAQDYGYVITRQDVTLKGKYLGKVIRVDTLRNIQEEKLRANTCARPDEYVAKATFRDIKGVSGKIREIKKRALNYAKTRSTILILGESGVGKEIFAQSIHNASSYADGPFIAVNCATFTENLLDSELFGYEDGTFTGGRKGGKPGLFEQAHGGTMFLDEIGDMPVQLQVKLLRVLQERTVRRLGGGKTIAVDVRTIFATNKDLFREVQRKVFREDLYYRINVLTLKIPPLRERPEDIPVLVKHMCGQISSVHSLAFSIPSKIFNKMQKLPWRGNVREVNNFVQKLMALCQDMDCTAVIDSLLDEMLEPQDEVSPHANPFAAASDHLLVPVASMQKIEQEVIMQLYARCQGNKKCVEQILDMSGTTLWRRFRGYFGPRSVQDM